MREMQLADRVMLVDDQMYDKLLALKTKVRLVNMGGHYYAMVSNKMVHRLVMEATSPNKIRHIDGNTLNNQLSNLVYAKKPCVPRPKLTDQERRAARIKSTQRWASKKFNKIIPEDLDSPSYRLKMKRRKIVNIAVGDAGSWYHSGQRRLFDSLRAQGETADFVVVNDKPNGTSPYMRKINAILDAYKAGAEQILYLDCSITAMKSLEPIWEYIEERGYYLYSSGYNCANTANDMVLEHFGLTRDSVEQWTEAATNVVGINVKHWAGEKIIKELMMGGIPECVDTVKWPSEFERYAESSDPRFLHSRQDQTVISLIAGKYKLPIEGTNHFVYRDEDGNLPNDKTIFKLRGGY